MNIEECKNPQIVKKEFPLLTKFIIELGPLANEPVTMSEYISIMNNKLSNDTITLEQVQQFYQINSNKEFIAMHNRQGWTHEETRLLVWIIIKYSKLKQIQELQSTDWEEISKLMGFKDPLTCSFKWLSSIKQQQTNQPWTDEEDRLLFQIIHELNLNQKWQEVSCEMYMRSHGQFLRKGKQFRERWNNYLNPQMKRGLWTEDEDLYMLELAIEEGLKWSNIAKRLGNRTENAVKNRMKSLINKQRKIVPTNQPILQLDDDLNIKKIGDKLVQQ